MPTRIPEVIGALADNIINPRLHTIPLLLQNRLIAIGHIVLPRDNGSGIGPANTTCTYQAIEIGDNIGHTTILGLIQRQILEPLTEEVLHVAVERCRAEEHLRITRPSQTLISLRAVGRHIQEVTRQTPLYITLELVYLVVR